MRCTLCPVPIGRHVRPVPDGGGGEAHSRCVAKRTRAAADALAVRWRPDLVIGQTYMWPPHRVVMLRWVGTLSCEVQLDDGTTAKCAASSMQSRRSVRQ